MKDINGLFILVIAKLTELDEAITQPPILDSTSQDYYADINRIINLIDSIYNKCDFDSKGE